MWIYTRKIKYNSEISKLKLEHMMTLIGKGFRHKWETCWVQFLVYSFWAFDWTPEEMAELYAWFINRNTTSGKIENENYIHECTENSLVVSWKSWMIEK